jgi:CBS domain-containing protein
LFEDLRNLRLDSLVQEPLRVSSGEPVSKIIGAMIESRAYQAFVEHGDNIRMITLRSLLDIGDPANTKVSGVSVTVPMMRGSEDVGHAARLMAEYRIRAVPIGERGKLMGQVNSGVLLFKMEAQTSSKLRANDVMTPQPVTATATDLVTKARSIMRRRGFDHIPILQNGKVSGILTSYHIISRLLPASRVARGAGMDATRRFDYPIAEIMDKTPLTCTPVQELRSIIKVMSSTDSSYCLAILMDEAQGIITHRDFMNLLAAEEAASKLPITLIGLPEDPFEAELAKLKFNLIAAALNRSMRDVDNIRAVIKVHESEADKSRYEVTVAVSSPRRRLTFSDEGWDLPSIFDRFVSRVKRLPSKSSGFKRNRSPRKSAERPYRYI